MLQCWGVRTMGQVGLIVVILAEGIPELGAAWAKEGQVFILSFQSCEL